MKRVAMFICMLMLVPQLSFASSEGLKSCRVCGMYTDAYQQTATLLTYKDGHKDATCGVACMMRLVNDAGGPDAFTAITVRGWDNNKKIAADKATYIIGSKVIPDMLPNLIAFSSKETAEKFRLKNGGELLSFTQALLSISPMGMTMPVKIKSAVIGAKGATGVGGGFMYMVMDDVQEGSDNIDPAEYIKRAGQMMVGKKMTTKGEMAMLSFSPTDNIGLGLSISDLHKRMEMYASAGSTTTTSNNNGISDLSLNMRYNLWRGPYYDKFFSLLVGATIPTGDFDTAFTSSPGMQLGTGDFTGTTGLLYSQRIHEFWLHSQLSYTHKLENSDDYKFGDETSFGAAIHYTPNFDLMMGLEVNGTNYAKNENNGTKVDNTGGFRSYATGVLNWRFLTVMGGNFNLRLAGGVPIYEDMDHYTTMGQESVQLGGGYFTNAMVTFKRRYIF